MRSTAAPAVRGVADLLALYESDGDRCYGEQVSLTAHSLQCAALAGANGATDSLIAAALLHDVGHLLIVSAEADPGRSTATARHEAVGGRALAALFGPRVGQPVSLHVQAKRWRCTAEPGYRSTLSAASAASLEVQGGLLDDRERARFETHPGFSDSVRLRQWDDEAKVVGLGVPPLGAYRPLLETLVRARPATRSV